MQRWYSLRVVNVAVLAPRVCMIELEGDVTLRLETGTAAQLVARLEEFAMAETVQLSTFDPSRRESPRQFWGSDGSVAVGSDGATIIVVDISTPADAAPYAEPSVAPLIGYLLDQRHPELLQPRTDLASAPFGASPIQCGSSFVAMNAEHTAMVTLALGLTGTDVAAGRQGVVKIGDPARGAVSFGTNLDSSRCTDLPEEPSPQVAGEWPIVAGEIAYEIVTGEPCLSASITATGLRAERPDGVIVALSDLVVANSNYTYLHPEGCLPPK